MSNLKFEIHWYHLLIFYAKTNIFTPGPSQLYPTVPQHLQNAIQSTLVPYPIGKKFQIIFQEMKSLLLTYLISPDYEIFITSSATEIWERIIQNLIINSSHHFINGSFSLKDFITSQLPIKLSLLYKFRILIKNSIIFKSPIQLN